MAGSQNSQAPLSPSTGRGRHSSRHGSTAGLPQGFQPSIQGVESTLVTDQLGGLPPTLTQDLLYTEQMGALYDDECEILEDIDEQEYVYGTRSPEQKYD